jgi:hypothetical protein
MKFISLFAETSHAKHIRRRLTVYDFVSIGKQLPKFGKACCPHLQPPWTCHLFTNVLDITFLKPLIFLNTFEDLKSCVVAIREFVLEVKYMAGWGGVPVDNHKQGDWRGFILC